MIQKPGAGSANPQENRWKSTVGNLTLPKKKPRPPTDSDAMTHFEGHLHKTASELLDERLEGEDRKQKGNDDYSKLLAKEIDRRRKLQKSRIKESIMFVCTKADMFAAAHTVPIHLLCIALAAIFIPLSILAVIWDLLAVELFEIPDLSTIALPTLMLFINFLAIPLAMYGYMMEYLLHEHSRPAIVALICLAVHIVLFVIRAVMEIYYNGYRQEEKLFIEDFSKPGPDYKYATGVIHYRDGCPYSDSPDEQDKLRATFGKDYEKRC